MAIWTLRYSALTPEDSADPSASRTSFVLPGPLPAILIDVEQAAAWSDLIARLGGLGFTVHMAREGAGDGPIVRITDSRLTSLEGETAFVVVAHTRSVQALAAAIAAGASGYFVVPVDFHSLSATVCAAASRAREVALLQERAANLHESLSADQIVSTVVGILMERYHLPRPEAYERLRRYSRTERRKVVEVATEIVTASEELGKTLRAIESITREH
jgi:hypothetical protein